MHYGHDELAGPLSAAAAVVLVRGLFELDAVSRCARALRIPLYYFLDDNFIVLREQRGSGAAFVEPYSTENVREALGGFSGVLLASSPLVDYFAENGLHSRLLLFPPTEGDQVKSPAPAARPRVHIAFFGGRHLHACFLRTIVPAVRRVARRRPVTLIAVGVGEQIDASEGLMVVHQPYDESYMRAIRRLADQRVDVLVHPAAADLANNAFKNPHALISANALGAVPIVSNRAPYDRFQSEGVALLCEDSEDSWYHALVQVAEDDTASAIRMRLATFCAEHFGGGPNLEIINGMLRERIPPARWSTPWRAAVARAILLMNRAGRAVSRARRIMRSQKAAAA